MMVWPMTTCTCINIPCTWASTASWPSPSRLGTWRWRGTLRQQYIETTSVTMQIQSLIPQIQRCISAWRDIHNRKRVGYLTTATAAVVMWAVMWCLAPFVLRRVMCGRHHLAGERFVTNMLVTLLVYLSFISFSGEFCADWNSTLSNAVMVKSIRRICVSSKIFHKMETLRKMLLVPQVLMLAALSFSLVE